LNRFTVPPRYCRTGPANPIAAVWAAKLMLDHWASRLAEKLMRVSKRW
jgi:isocitrate/isopropylmalate dehydrogenase